MKVETQAQTTKTYTLHLSSQEAKDLRTLLHLAVSTLSTALPAKLVDLAVPRLSDRGNVIHRALVDSSVQIDTGILHVEDELRLRLLEKDRPAPARVAVESRQPARRGWEVQVLQRRVRHLETLQGHSRHLHQPVRGLQGPPHPAQCRRVELPSGPSRGLRQCPRALRAGENDRREVEARPGCPPLRECRQSCSLPEPGHRPDRGQSLAHGVREEVIYRCALETGRSFGITGRRSIQ